MKSNSNLFHEILTEFYNAGVLENVILIGSWVLPIYKHYFSDTTEIPILRTTDVDFLIKNPPKINIKVDIPKILEHYGFVEVYSLMGNYTKFSQPDLEVEFLIPEMGRGRKKAVFIRKLNITAQPLRYLNFIQNHIITVDYKGITLKVPEPATFTLMKFLLTINRKKIEKINKDLRTATALTKYLIKRNDQKVSFKVYFADMPKTWQKKLKPIIKLNSPDLYKILFMQKL